MKYTPGPKEDRGNARPPNYEANCEHLVACIKVVAHMHVSPHCRHDLATPESKKLTACDLAATRLCLPAKPPRVLKKGSEAFRGVTDDPETYQNIEKVCSSLERPTLHIVEIMYSP